jgi:hypothetical protein
MHKLYLLFYVINTTYFTPYNKKVPILTFGKTIKYTDFYPYRRTSYFNTLSDHPHNHHQKIL